MPGELLTIVAPTFLCAAAGFLWGRFGPGYDRAGITALITNLGFPCLVFSSLVRLQLEPRAMAEIAGAALLACACFGALGALVLRAWGLPLHTFLAPLIFGNSGNMGLPLCLFAFGPEGLALGICFYAVSASTHFTLGLLIWSGRASFAELWRNPLFGAAIAAVVVIAADLSVPDWLLFSTELLGGFALPLMLLTLGARSASCAPCGSGARWCSRCCGSDSASESGSPWPGHSAWRARRDGSSSCSRRCRSPCSTT